MPIELVEIPALDVIRIKVAFGEQLCKAVNDGYYKEDDDDEYFPGFIKEFEFNSKEEADSFVNGLFAMDGFYDYSIMK